MQLTSSGSWYMSVRITETIPDGAYVDSLTGKAKDTVGMKTELLFYTLKPALPDGARNSIK